VAVSGLDTWRAGDYAVVVPTVGRPSLGVLLDSLAATEGPLPSELVVVDDRPTPAPLPPAPDRLVDRLRVLSSGGRGPAAARNVGWRTVRSRCPWVVFLDDDVVLPRDWAVRLLEDLSQPPEVVGVQARLTVPLPIGRRPTDWERGTRGLQRGWWITADMAYRRDALERVGGLDERFPRAFREDADLALRVKARGGRLVRGSRTTIHPVRPADRWVSVRVQAGNADDPLMRRLHGPRWRQAAHAGTGRRGRHGAVTAAAVGAVTAALAGRREVAGVLAAGWLAGTGLFAWERIAPGPRDRDEVATMLLTSVAIPPVATWHWLRGWWRHRSAAAWTAEVPVSAVLFDRDGTLVHDEPYNADPDLVRPVAGALQAVDRLRARGVRTGVVTNQSGIGRGLLSQDQVRRVNRRVDEIFGGFDVWALCPHVDEDRCRCRKPAPGMVLKAARQLGVPAREVVVIGDIAADVHAALGAGARGILVPNRATRPDEVAAAPLVAQDLPAAVEIALGGAR
jgi:histidinol-phosphate phosphatase family protein